jgi:4-hydroxybenzoate polyprenyltransferase
MEKIRILTSKKKDPLASKVVGFFGAIRFQESIFALPFAYTGMILASNGIPSLGKFLLITLAMISARTVGMVANRVIDRQIDAVNPRTKNRHLPAGILKSIDLIIPAVICSIIFFWSASQLNNLSFYLSPLAITCLIIYPYSKRYTWTSNLLLGWTLAIAPSAAWIGIQGSLSWQPVLLSFSVAAWAGSFDILYHCQDINFHKAMGLHSVASKFGVVTSFHISKILDVVSLVCLAGLGFWMNLGIPFFMGCLIATSLLAYKYVLVKPHDLSKMGIAFMRINAFVSTIILLGTLISVII